MSESHVVIDPERRFGRAQVRGVGTSIIADRFRAGESVDEIASDYELTREHVESALRYDMTRRRKHPASVRADSPLRREAR